MGWGSVIGGVASGLGSLFGGNKKAKVNQTINIGSQEEEGKRKQALLDLLTKQAFEGIDRGLASKLPEMPSLVERLQGGPQGPWQGGLLDTLLQDSEGPEGLGEDSVEALRAKVLEQLQGFRLPQLAALVSRAMRGARGGKE